MKINLEVSAFDPKNGHLLTIQTEVIVNICSYFVLCTLLYRIKWDINAININKQMFIKVAVCVDGWLAHG